MVQAGSDALSIVVVILFAIMAVGGWVANIVKLVGSDVITGMVIARAIGIVVAPLGALLGYF